MKKALLSGSVVLCLLLAPNSNRAGTSHRSPSGAPANSTTTTVTYTITACIDDNETLWIEGNKLQWAVYSGSPIGQGHGAGNGYDCRNPGVNDGANIEIQTVNASSDPTMNNESSDVTYHWKPTYNKGLKAEDNPKAQASDFYTLETGGFPTDQTNVKYEIKEVLDRGPVTMYCPKNVADADCTTTGGSDPQGGTPQAIPYDKQTGTTKYKDMHFNFVDHGLGAVQYRIVVTVTTSK